LSHRLAELDQINVDLKVNWYRMARRKVDQKIVHESECYSMKRPSGDKKCEVWKSSETRVQFVTYYIQLVQQIPYQVSYQKAWRLQNVKTSISQCET
jgi:hypothetical protein